MMDYSSCCLNNQSCGPHTRSRTTGVFKVDDLKYDVNSHLVFLKLQHHYEREADLDEKSLIENRMGSTFEDDNMICAYHRLTLGIGWKPLKRCQHPSHPSTKKKKAPAVRSVPIKTLKILCNKYEGLSFPIGTVFCFPHLKEDHSTDERSIDNCGKDGIDDYDYVPDEIQQSDESMTKADNASMDICNLDTSPLSFQVKRKRIDELSLSTKKSLITKYKKVKKQLKKRFAEAAAPGQEEEFLAKVLGESSEDDDDGSTEIGEDLAELLELYPESDSVSKLVILALVNHNKYDKKQLMDLFGCSRYKIDQARKWKAEHNESIIPEKVSFTRNRLNIDKCEHFLDFIFSSGLLQDVAYGIHKIKFDSGIVETVPKAILTTRYSHTIGFYKQNCIKIGYEPLSVSSLWTILKTIKPSQRKSLAGLDDITAAGMNAFDLLEKITKDSYINDSGLVNSLQKGKRYLKTQYQLNCSTDSEVASHNCYFALSDPKDEKLQQISVVNEPPSKVCTECFGLFKALQELQDVAKSNNTDEDTLHDIAAAIKDINDYVKHLIRDAQQKKARTFSLDKMDANTAFWIKDFCQKLLPTKFREGQKDYFGKKGMSLHVDIFFTKVDGELKKRTYFTCVHRCDQDAKDVLSINDNVIKQFKNDAPTITKICTKSDNAGCYHTSHSPEPLYQLCQREGFQLLRYDYNEPCKGKDQCDRESASAKAVIRSYIDAGNDLMSSFDVFKAMHYGFGVKDAMVCVAEIDCTKASIIGPKVSSFTSYHSIQFEEDGMRMWRYFDVGEGVFQPYVDVKFTSGINVIKNFSKTDSGSHSSKLVSKRRDERSLNCLLFCTEVGCSEVFNDQEVYEKHIAEGNHVAIDDKTAMDKVRRSFTSRMKVSTQICMSVRGAEVSKIDMKTACDTYETMKIFQHVGWALPVRSNFKYSLKQKKVLYDFFIDGERNGKKMSADQVAKLSRNQLLSSEYITEKQIKSLFSRWSKLLRSGKLNPPTNIESECDIEAIEDEIEDNDNHGEIQEEAIRITNLMTWSKDDWVAVLYEGEWFPGVVNEVDSLITVKSMLFPTFGKNCFKWPSCDDVIPYQPDDIICKISPPKPISSRFFGLSNDDFNEISRLFGIRKSGK